MRRRHWLAAVALLAAGCSSSTGTKKRSTKRKKSTAPQSTQRPKKSSGLQRMNQGPQGFGDVLLPSYIDDLKSGSTAEKVKAARELGNMGPRAKSALSTLEKLAADDKDPSVRAAAKTAATAIKSR